MNNKYKVLILGMSETQLDAIKVLKKMGLAVYTCASYIGIGSEYADRCEIIDIKDKKKIEKYILDNDIQLIYSVGSDLAMNTIIHLSNKLNLKSFYNKELIHIIQNKISLRRYLGYDFKGNIEFQVIGSIDDKIKLDYPFVLKPSDSQGQRGVSIVRSKDEFLDKYHKSMKHSLSKKLIIERFIEGIEVSVNAHVLEEKIIFMVITDRTSWDKFEGGIIKKHIIPSVIDSNMIKKIKSLVKRTTSKLKIKNGPIYFQIKIMDENPYLIEVTPRLDGCHLWRLIKKHTNVNILKLTLDHLIMNNLKELNNYRYSEKRYELNFLCKEPNEIVCRKDLIIEKNTIFKSMYYKEGDMIRPVNGIYEKIGYYIIEK